jgi:hypothetical protein
MILTLLEIGAIASLIGAIVFVAVYLLSRRVSVRRRRARAWEILEALLPPERSVPQVQ